MGRKRSRRGQSGQVSANSAETQRRTANRDNATQKTDDPRGSPCHGPKASNDEEHQAEERSFWAKQIGVGRWLNIITGAGATAALGGLIALIVSIWFDRQAAIDTNRAWISVGWVNDGFSATGFLYDVQFNNLGKTPATDVLVAKPESFFRPVKWVVNRIAIDIPDVDACAPYRNAPTPHLGLAVFPGTGVRQRFGIPIAPFKKWIDAMMRGDIALVVIGCVPYNSYGVWRFTQYCFIHRQMEKMVTSSCDKTYAT